MNKALAATTLAGAAIASAACGSTATDDTTNGLHRPMTPPTGMVTETTTSTVESLNRARLAAFVVAFRAEYSELAQDRDDASIETIALRSCEDITNGIDDQLVSAEIRSLASNNGTEPDETDVQHIYDMATTVCNR